jgi:hypothetical protein
VRVLLVDVLLGGGLGDLISTIDVACLCMRVLRWCKHGEDVVEGMRKWRGDV